jgi:hypothetical protein
VDVDRDRDTSHDTNWRQRQSDHDLRDTGGVHPVAETGTSFNEQAPACRI